MTSNRLVKSRELTNEAKWQSRERRKGTGQLKKDIRKVKRRERKEK
jgi:hypothetical protein